MTELVPVIHVLGCSWSRNGCNNSTYTFVDNQTLSWPEMLQVDLGKQYRIRNWSMNGNSNNMILAQCERVLRDFRDEKQIIIIQFTRPLRQTFARDFETISNHTHPSKLRHSNHSQLHDLDYKEIPYPNSQDFNFNDNGFCLAHPGMLNKKGKFKKTYQDNLLHLVDISKISETLHTEAIQRHCKLLCERAGVPHVIYSHVDAPEADNSHLDFIAHRDWKQMEDYCIDTGLHLDARGNRILLDRYIKPCMFTKI